MPDNDALMVDHVFGVWEAFAKENDAKEKKKLEKSFTEKLKILSVTQKALIHEKIEAASDV